jgi:hypothetical protein
VRLTPVGILLLTVACVLVLVGALADLAILLGIGAVAIVFLMVFATRSAQR